MSQIIEIDGDQVRLIERQTIRSVTLADVIPHLENRPPVHLFHPRTAVMTLWDESNPNNKRAAFLCELAPSVRSIVKSARRYRLAMPWTYFLFSFNATGDTTNGRSWGMGTHKVFHTNERVTGLNSRLWTAFLPNVYEDGNICFGSTGVDPNQQLADRVDALVNTWYLTEFNNDVIGSRHHPMPFDSSWPHPGFRPWVDATTEHGASAWVTFPEWNYTAGENNATSRTVGDLLTNEGLDRPATISVVGEIPAIPMPATFGRAEEWLRALNPLQRRQLLMGLANIDAENPDDIAPEADLPNVNPEEDGGEPI